MDWWSQSRARHVGHLVDPVNISGTSSDFIDLQWPGQLQIECLSNR